MSSNSVTLTLTPGLLVTVSPCLGGDPELKTKKKKKNRNFQVQNTNAREDV